MNVGLFLAGVTWIVALLALTIWRAFRVRPPLRGASSWPNWIAIASPLAAALAPVWVFMLFAAWMSGEFLARLALFGPLALSAAAGVAGVVWSFTRKRA